MTDARNPASGMVTTEDRVELPIGARAFNYYDRKPGRIRGWDRDGWFDFDHDDGTSALLDGSRICSVGFAEGKGWM
jgi:hypothetical protein